MIEALVVAGESGILLFIDIVSAFYTLVKQLIVQRQYDHSDEAVAMLCKDIGLVPDATHRRAARLKGDGALYNAGADAHLVEMVKEVYTDTYFLVQGMQGIARPRRGARPGDPMAGNIFGFLVADKPSEVRHKFKLAGIKFKVHWSGKRMSMPHSHLKT